MSGLETLRNNIAVFEQEAEEVRSRAARLGVYLAQMKAELDRAINQPEKKKELGV